MNPKKLQYLVGHCDLSVTLKTYTDLGLEGAQNKLVRVEELEDVSGNLI